MLNLHHRTADSKRKANRGRCIMKTEQELLESLKKNRAKRIQLLEMQEKSQLIRLIESLGHFDLVDEDIAWLDQRVNNVGA